MVEIELKKSCLWSILKTLLILGVILILISYGNNLYIGSQIPDNVSKSTPFSRKAVGQDYESSFDFSVSLNDVSIFLIITPNVDIKDLQVSLTALDENDNELHTTYKQIGDVLQNIDYEVELTLRDLSNLVDIAKIDHWLIKTTRGTVKNFF